MTDFTPVEPLENNQTPSNLIDLEGAFAVAHEQLPVRVDAMVPGEDENGNAITVAFPNPVTMENAILVKDVIDLCERSYIDQMKVNALLKKPGVTEAEVQSFQEKVNLAWQNDYPFSRLLTIIMSWIGPEGYNAINRRFKMSYADHGVMLEKIGAYYATDLGKVDSGKS